MTKAVPIAKVATLNPPAPRDLFDDPRREVSFVPMAQLGEDGRLCNGQARPVGELTQGYTYFANGDVIVAKITPCLQNGKAAYVENLKGGHGFGSTEFHVIRPGKMLDGRYLFFMVWNPAFRHFGEQRFTGSAGQKRMPSSAVAEFAIPLPYPDDPKRSLAEQKRIAAILDRADAIRRRRHEAAGLTDQLIPSLFHEMFGDPVLNPKQWPESPIASCAEVSGGIALSQARASLDLQVPYLRVANVLRDRLDLSEIKTVGVTPEEHRKTQLKQNDILVVEGHGNRDEIGRSAIWDGSIPDCIHQNHLIRVRVDDMQITPEFLNAFINSEAGRRQLFQHGKTTSGLNTISLTNVRETMTLLPPLRLQERFSRAVREAKSFAAHRLETSNRHDELFNSLVQRAFRGEL